MTSRNQTAVYVSTVEPAAEGRLVRGGAAVPVGAAVRVRLVSVDVRRAYIDFVPA